MKTKQWLLTAWAILALAAQQAWGGGACTAARFHNWQDLGCDPCYAGAGSGSATRPCPCHGMPQWWVTEPYIDLCMKDTPLSYTMSSGQEMDFTFYYRTRTQLPESDEMTLSTMPADDIYPGYANACTAGTNAWWGNNWTMSITVWDPGWESSWRNIGGGWSPPTYAVYTQGYSALVWRPEGGLNYYNVPNGGQNNFNSQSQVRLASVASGQNYPAVEAKIGVNEYINRPSADSNGIYWGDAGIGVMLADPDGSTNIFGLSAYPITEYNPTSPAGTSTERLLLTEKIDPQGRITRLGYEQETNTIPYCYRVRYVVDPDGRTNTFLYNSGFQLAQIVDPYGRNITLNYYSATGYSGLLSSIVDAARMTNSFTYQPPTWATNGSPPVISVLDNGWISALTTTYGTNSFLYYQVAESDVTDGFQQRAIYINEPAGAQQLYFYYHNNPTEASNDVPPTVTGQTFDSGASGSIDPSLIHRNSYHWGRLQYEALVGNYYFNEGIGQAFEYQVSNPGYSQSEFASALGALTQNDFNKAGLKHWLLSGADSVSITESVSSERDPSPDAGGAIPGLRTWYNYLSKPSGEPEELGSDPQISCIARLLPDGTSQYTVYNFYPTTSIANFPPGAGMVSNNITTYSLPNGSIGTLTNWFVYATNGIDLTSVSNSAGQRLNYGYNTSHQITSVTNVLNQVTALSWNPNLTGIQWPGGQAVSLSYGTADYGRLDNISWSPSGRSFTINSYSNGLPFSVTDDRGVTVSNTWDGLNRLTGVLFPDGTTISNIYLRLDVVGAKDRLGNWTHYGFDGLDHLTDVTNADSAVWQFDWCGCGSLLGILDPLANLTSLNYDNQGNLTNIFFPDSTSLTYQFDLAGRMTNAFDGAGRSLQLAYNNQGLPTSVTGSSGTLHSAIYDALNRPVIVTDANGVTVTNTFDAIDELLSRTWPDGIGESYGYNAAGLIAYTNRDGQPTYFGLDDAGRITSVTNANHEVIQLGYDSLNDVTSLVDGLGHETTWQYNQYGWLTNKLDGLNRNAFQFAYNANGWLTNRWTPEKGNTGYAYDNVGNLKTIMYPSLTNSYFYDADNRLTNMVDATGTNVFAYTPAGQLAGESNAWAAVSYAYSQGLRTATSLNSPSSTFNFSYGYDSVWRMTNVVSPAGSFIYHYSSSVFNLPSSLSLPNAAYITNTFDALARLKETDLKNYWGHTLDGYAYGFDPLGLRTNIVRNLGLASSTVSIGFDNLGQITSWLAAESNGLARMNEQFGFGYDSADNLHSRTNNLLAQTFTVDGANEVTNVSRAGTFTLSGAIPAPATNITVNGQAAQTYGDFTFAATNLTLANGNNTFTNVAQNVYGLTVSNILTVSLPANVNLAFDNDGNLTNDGLRGFSYDSENQLTNITVTGQSRIDFVYDGLNRRRIERDYSWIGSSWAKTNEVHFVYDGDLLVQERDTNNNVLVTYTRGRDFSGDLQDAGGIGGLLARTDTNGSTFYHSDGNGNITALMDGNENIVARYLYSPFGKLLGQWGVTASVNEMQFSSMPSRGGVSLYPFRGYDPNFQRWLNEDPIQENGGFNLYRTMNNNSVNYIDSYGLWWGQGAFDSVGDAELNLWDKMFVGGNGPAADPNSQGVLSQNAGYGFQPLYDENGNPLGNPASAVGANVLNSLATAAMMMTPFGPGEDAAGALGNAAEDATKATKICPTEAARAAMGKGPLANPGA
ncbi:MAG TPA: RHS repeat-associated core domain-containing protein, partial [Verrucomicrobiae bacterium]